MWQKKNNNYYKIENGEIIGAIIYHDEMDGANPNTYGLQINVESWNVIDYMDVSSFVLEEAKQIVNAAIIKADNL